METLVDILAVLFGGLLPILFWAMFTIYFIAGSNRLKSPKKSVRCKTCENVEENGRELMSCPCYLLERGYTMVDGKVTPKE